MCQCITEQQMLEVYRNQVKYDPNEKYAHRFLPNRDNLDNMKCEVLIYDQIPDAITKEAYDTHVKLGQPYTNFELQHKLDHIEGLKYIESKVPIPSVGEGFLKYPSILNNPILVPPNASLFNNNVYPPAKFNTYHVTSFK